MEISTHLEDSRERKFSHRDPEQVLSKTGIARHTCPVCFLAFSDLGWTRHLLRNPACAIELLRPGKTQDQYQRKTPHQEPSFQELHNQWKQEKRASRSLVLTAPTINCNTFPKLPSCQDHPTFRFWHPDHGYVPFHCGSWNCPDCAPVKVENIASLMIKASLENDLTRHLALTLDPKLVQGDPWVYFQKTWHKMAVYLGRRAKKNHRRLKWQKVVQIQPGTGLPHAHLMLSEFVPFSWIKKAWKGVGGGSVYIRYVDIQTVSGFIKGYFTKQVLNQDFPARKRRYSCSRNISLTRPKQAGWEIRQWISAPTYSKKGYVTGVEREDFILPPSAWLLDTEEPLRSGDLQDPDYLLDAEERTLSI